MTRKRFVLMDRDGTLLVPHHYLSSPELVQLIPGAASALRQLRAAGWGLAVVTNQSAIGRGYFDHSLLKLIHERMTHLLEREDVRLDGIYFCPHTPDDHCGCRKPEPGLVFQAAVEHDFDPSECVVVGDNVCDIRLGESVGATTCLVRTGYGAQVEFSARVRPDHVAENIWAAAQVIRRLPPQDLRLPAVDRQLSAVLGAYP